ncbi:hypothetical protein DOY81_008307 [Sarcophaga bullata]|nr:hypothetical protein DOY81_008307 [Sarcophaga bullata]
MFSRVHSDKENMSNIQLKNADSTRKHQSRKQIFGEIRNTIHNQAFATPLKQEIRTPKPNTSNHVSNSINRNDVKQCKSKVPEKNKCDISSFNMSYSNLLDEIELLYYFDFRGYCCVKPRKSDQQIWSEMNFYDDSFLNTIIYDNLSSKEENDTNENFIKYQQFEEEGMKHDNNLIYWSDSTTSGADLDSHLEEPIIDEFYFAL